MTEGVTKIIKKKIMIEWIHISTVLFCKLLRLCFVFSAFTSEENLIFELFLIEGVVLS